MLCRGLCQSLLRGLCRIWVEGALVHHRQRWDSSIQILHRVTLLTPPGVTPLMDLLKKDDQKAQALDKLATLLELHFKVG